MKSARSGLAGAVLTLSALGLAIAIAAPSSAQEHDRGPPHGEARGHERERHEHRRPVRHERYVPPETVYAPPPVIYAPPPPPLGINLIIPFTFR